MTISDHSSLPPADRESLTPSQLNRQVRCLLESHYDFLWIEGEISNFARPSSGHWYFTLKDDSAQVRCAMFRNRNQRLRMQPQNGDAVRLRARVSLYEGRGEFQLLGEFMEATGAGALQARFEALRDRLRDEGLFDSARKRPLPAHVGHLAVISSPTGAALQDILQVLARRNPAIRVTVLPVPVQGEQAPAQLCAAIRQANTLADNRPDSDFDAIIVARGGGSIEDLWAFNDESLARAIAASALPVVVGVGHEVDFTIADFAADTRAPTPSAAAELLSTDRSELLARLRGQQSRLSLAVERQLERTTLRLGGLRSSLRHPGALLREKAQRLDEAEARLQRVIEKRLQSLRQDQRLLSYRLHSASPQQKMRAAGQQILLQKNTLNHVMQIRLRLARDAIAQRAQLLESLSPVAVLRRGYAILSDGSGHALMSSADVGLGDSINARLASGSLTLQVTGSERETSA
ncbi:MAG: exodeoxyribonuclease VII large subunit [Halieaceae bacterium]|jgi:exodeoxyribonuclease VII large subunit